MSRIWLALFRSFWVSWPARCFCAVRLISSPIRAYISIIAWRRYQSGPLFALFVAIQRYCSLLSVFLAQPPLLLSILLQ